jgi:phage terminase large subunit-like protein
MDSWQPYIDSVLGGTRLAGRLELLSVQRCVRLMNDTRYVFDAEEAGWAIDVISGFKHTKGDFKGKRFQLMDWQKFFLAYIFGLKHKGSGLRVTRKVLLCIAKKGGKSELAGAISVLMAFFDGEQAAEVYSVANKKDQALYCWNSGKVMMDYLKAEGKMSDIRVYNSQQNYELVSKLDALDNSPDGSFFRAISADSGTLDGVFPHLSCVDEYHEARDSSIPDNLESGSVGRAQPLLIITTTRGFNVLGTLWQLEQRYISILEGSIENDEVFPLIFSMDDKDDWEVEANWEKSNPGIGQAPPWEGLRSQYVTAVTEGATRMTSFITKNLNRWQKTNTTWIKREDYMQASTDFDEKILHGRLCYGGLDLATVKDLAVWSLVFPPTQDDPKFRTISRSWCAEDRAKHRAMQDKVPYMDWAAGGWLTLTPGKTIDYEYIRAQIISDFSVFEVHHANYDRFNASQLINELLIEGIEMVAFNQSFMNFSPAVLGMEKEILDGLWDHQNNPVVAWCFQNVMLKQDAGGNVRIDKSRSREKVDAAVANAMAYAGYLEYKEDEQESTGEIFVW